MSLYRKWLEVDVWSLKPGEARATSIT